MQKLKDIGNLIHDLHEEQGLILNYIGGFPRESSFNAMYAITLNYALKSANKVLRLKIYSESSERKNITTKKGNLPGTSVKTMIISQVEITLMQSFMGDLSLEEAGQYALLLDSLQHIGLRIQKAFDEKVVVQEYYLADPGEKPKKGAILSKVLDKNYDLCFAQLYDLKTPQIRKMAQDLELSIKGRSKADLVEAFIQAVPKSIIEEYKAWETLSLNRQVLDSLDCLAVHDPTIYSRLS
jgi:hypothetical protein